jgi:hypothetical protein
MVNRFSLQLTSDLLLLSLLVQLKQDTSILRVMYREGPEGTPYHSLCMDGLINGPMATGELLPPCAFPCLAGIFSFSLPPASDHHRSCGIPFSSSEIAIDSVTAFETNDHITTLFVGRHWKLFLLPHIPACMSMA